jgi:hypothetical protein
MSLGDLVALVAGAAVAVSVSGSVVERTLAGRPAPNWYIVLSTVRDILLRGCPALVPVILARKLRLGGPVRPAEFAVLCGGLPFLPGLVFQWPALGIVVPVAEDPGRFTININAYWTFHVVSLLLCVLAALVLVRSYRRLPGWCAGLLLFAAWHGLTEFVWIFYSEALQILLWRNPPRLPHITLNAIDRVLTLIPSHLVGYVPTAFAVLDALRPPRPGRTWVEWAGLGLTLSAWVVFEVQALVNQRLGYGPKAAVLDALALAIPCVVFALSFALARLLDPTLRRWLGLPERPRLVPGARGWSNPEL